MYKPVELYNTTPDDFVVNHIKNKTFDVYLSGKQHSECP